MMDMIACPYWNQGAPRLEQSNVLVLFENSRYALIADELLSWI